MGQIENVINALNANNMNAFVVESRDKVPQMLRTMIQPGQKVFRGGSVTLDQCGVAELLKNGEYNFLDKWAPDLSPEQRDNLQKEGISADVIVTGVNVITESGQLYCVDASGTRVSLMIFGPRKVIVVAGRNKIVKDLDEAAVRMRTIAAPLNAKRLFCKTFCNASGKCINADSKELVPDNSNCFNTICCNTVIFSRQKIQGRINVIIVDEQLGY